MTDLIKRDDDDLLWPSAYVGTPEQLLNCVTEMWRREKRVTVSAVLHATIETLRALPVADSQPSVTVVNLPEYLCTFPSCGCVAKGQWCPVPCAIDPTAIREAALQARIEELVNALAWYQMMDAMCSDHVVELTEKLEAAEAKLTKAVEALREIKSVECVYCTDYFHELADAVLAELEKTE